MENAQIQYQARYKTFHLILERAAYIIHRICITLQTVKSTKIYISRLKHKINAESSHITYIKRQKLNHFPIRYVMTRASPYQKQAVTESLHPSHMRDYSRFPGFRFGALAKHDGIFFWDFGGARK